MKYDRFVILLPGISIHHGGRKAGEFFYRPEYKGHIYKNTEYPLDRLNEIAPKIIEQYKNFIHAAPYVVLVEAANAPVDDVSAEHLAQMSETLAALTGEKAALIDANTALQEEVDRLKAALAPYIEGTHLPIPPSPPSPEQVASGEGSGSPAEAGAEGAGAENTEDGQADTEAESPSAEETSQPDRDPATDAPATPAKKATSTKKATTKKAAPAKDGGQ